MGKVTFENSLRISGSQLHKLGYLYHQENYTGGMLNLGSWGQKTENKTEKMILVRAL